MELEDSAKMATVIESPFIAGTQAHTRRVAAWSAELARQLKLPAHEQALVEQTAKAHHYPVDQLDGSAVTKLGRELGLIGDDSIPGITRPAPVVYALLQNLRGCGSFANPRLTLLAGIIDMANFWDEQLEFSPYADRPLEGLLDRAIAAGRELGYSAELLNALQSLRVARPADLDRVVRQLPVYPEAALQALRLLQQQDPDFEEVQALARKDAVLAGKLLEAANSSLHSPAKPIGDITQAISYIGARPAARAMAAASLGQIFESEHLRELWRHSIETAETAEAIARLSGRVDAHQAFLAGLLHDIGRLPIAQLRPEVQSALERLTSAGCETVTAEQAVCGFDHAEAGTRVLSKWRVPLPLVNGIRWHHEPERTGNPLAAILYLAEYWLDGREDVPARSRLLATEKIAGITLEQIFNAGLTMKSGLAEALVA